MVIIYNSLLFVSLAPALCVFTPKSVVTSILHYCSFLSFLFDLSSVLILCTLTIVWYSLWVYCRSYLISSLFTRYYTLIHMFIYSMLLLIVAQSGFLSLYAWECIGLCSFLLISYHVVRHAVQYSGVKAVVFTKVFDLFFYLFIFYPWSTLLALCSISKSSLFLIHVWLLDAMEGPTIVSTILHSSTLVMAGYTVVYVYDCYVEVLCVLGILTWMFVCVLASSSVDIKVTLAYSTVANMGLLYMITDHSITHGLLKASAFLIVGMLSFYLESIRSMSHSVGTMTVLLTVVYINFSAVPSVSYSLSEHPLLGNVYNYVSLILMALSGLYLISSMLISIESSVSDHLSARPSLSMVSSVFLMLYTYVLLSFVLGTVTVTFASFMILVCLLSLNLYNYSIKDRFYSLFTSVLFSLPLMQSYQTNIMSYRYQVYVPVQVMLVMIYVLIWGLL